MRVLFWNTNNNKNINPYIVSLVQDNDIDILITAEYKDNEEELVQRLKICDYNLHICNTLGCERINIWSNYVNVQADCQSEYYSIQVIDNEFILCCVHLVSDLKGDRSEERLVITQQIRGDLSKLEDKIKSQKTIIVGDFNEMPYGKGCLNANGFHGLPRLNLDEKPIRTINRVKYKKYYNPMWNLLGDYEHPPGTYYLNESKLYSPMWYILDQVIISREIIPIFKKESLKIITMCKYADLKDKNGRPNKKVSDHFPIMFEIDY